MKQKLLNIAIIGGVVCAVLALWPARSSLYYTAAYLGISACALLALLCLARPGRSLAGLALIFGLMGVFICWPNRARAWSAGRNPSQTQPAGGPRWIQWSSSAGGNDHYYALTPFATNWDAAQSLAVSLGGNLATITSPEEQRFINDTFLTGNFEYLPLWVGLVRASGNGAGKFSTKLRRAMADLGFHVSVPPATQFEWVTGEDFSYSNWKPGEPSNTDGVESWVAINWQYAKHRPGAVKGDWNDAPLNGTTGYGGNTDGPYFGLVEVGQPPGPILTTSRWGLVILAGLAVAAALAFIAIRINKLNSH